MSYSLTLVPPSLFQNNLRHNPPSFSPYSQISSCRIAKHKKFCTLISTSKTNHEVSWVQTEGNLNEELGGWCLRRKPEMEDRNGLPKFALTGAGASMVVLMGALAYFSFSKKGFKFRFDVPFYSFHEQHSSMTGKIPVKVIESSELEVDLTTGRKWDDNSVTESHPSTSEANHRSVLGENKRIIVPLAADSIQEEALNILKKLKIIEDDVIAEELCTRREYARWFVKANCMLERNPTHKILPMILIAGSTVTAFDDVSTNDPDFLSIQALGEAGIIFSKLSTVNSKSLLDRHCLDGLQRFNFSPDSFISRFDLVNWKAMLEYPFASAEEKMLRIKVGLLDLDASTLDVSPQLLMDLMAGDKSITRRVFGNIRLLQPLKPVTKAQAAVALASGRMKETIRLELSRLEAENQSRLAEMEEIRSELVQRGEIQRSWEDELDKEKERGVEVERDLQLASLELEKERMAHQEGLAEYRKEKTALDYQQQLLSNLRKEVDDIYDKLATEKENLFAEQQTLRELFADLSDQQQAIIEAKSILEAEKEALRILRYWVEEETRRIQTRSKFLEQAAQRWRGNSQTT